MQKPTRCIVGAGLTYESLRPNQLQRYLVSQDGGVAVGDVGKGAGMDEDRSPLWRERTL